MRAGRIRVEIPLRRGLRSRRRSWSRSKIAMRATCRVLCFFAAHPDPHRLAGRLRDPFGQAGEEHSIVQSLAVFGDKNVALALAAVAALLLLVLSSKDGAKGLKDKMQSALASGGVIILITAAGAAFGYVLKQTGITPS